MISVLPTLLENPNETISSFEIIVSDIGKVIKALKVNKAHGHNEIFIRMLRLYESAITEPLYLIFKIVLALIHFRMFRRRRRRQM